MDYIEPTGIWVCPPWFPPRQTKAQVIFEEAQQIIESMRFPKALKEAMHQAMTEVGTRDGEERLTKLLPGGAMERCHGGGVTSIPKARGSHRSIRWFRGGLGYRAAIGLALHPTGACH